MAMTKLRIRYTSAFGPRRCHICDFLLVRVVRVCILLFRVNISRCYYFFILFYAFVIMIILFDSNNARV